MVHWENWLTQRRKGGRADPSILRSWRLCVLSEAGVSISSDTSSQWRRAIEGAEGPVTFVWVMA
jgi:hypothetical protein